MGAEQLRERTYKFALDVVLFCRSLKQLPETYTIRNQIIRSSTSVSLNYSAACQARSKREWFSKICIVAEESDETHLLLRFIEDLELTDKLDELETLKSEALQLTRIFSKSKISFKAKQTQEPSVPYKNL